MSATARSLTPRFGIRATGAALAALLTFGIVSLLAQSLHVERFGDGAHLVHLERVTVTAQRPALAEPTLAAVPTAARSN